MSGALQSGLHAWVLDRYGWPGRLREMAPYGTGHINDTYCAVYDGDRGTRRYILQRVNERVFPDIPALMSNVERVTAHLRAKAEREFAPEEVDRRVLTLLRPRDGEPYLRDPEGGYWRAYIFIEGALTHDVLRGPDEARKAARAFARFQRDLADLPPPRLHETIPGFHHTPARLTILESAIEADAVNRAAGCHAEIDFVRRRAGRTARLVELREQGAIPERVTHNDTKINNVMLDDRTGEGVCVIDLDTCMPGLSLYDFGDMVRTATSPAAEDERDLSKVALRREFFEALAEGFLSVGRDFLTEAEIELLPFAGWLITMTIGIRFLADHLKGDVYFKVHRPDHNLDRCRTQFRLAECIEEAEDEMAAVVRRGG